MARYFLFYRLWIGYTFSFPVADFDTIADNAIEAERDRIAKVWAAANAGELEAFRERMRVEKERTDRLNRYRSSSSGHSLSRPRSSRRLTEAVATTGPSLTEEVELARGWRFPSRGGLIRLIPSPDAPKFPTGPRRVYFASVEVDPQSVMDQLVTALNARFCAPVANAQATIFNMRSVIRLGFDAAEDLAPERRLEIQLGIEDWRKNPVATILGIPIAQIRDDLERAVQLIAPASGREAISSTSMVQAPKHARSGKRTGRPRAETTVTEKAILAAWDTNRYDEYGKCAQELGCTAREVELVVDRRRKRQERAQ